MQKSFNGRATWIQTRGAGARGLADSDAEGLIHINMPSPSGLWYSYYKVIHEQNGTCRKPVLQ